MFRKPNRENSGKDTGGNEKNGKKTSGVSVVVYLLIVLIGGFALYKTGIMGNLIPGLDGNSGKNVGTQASSQKKTDTTAETSKKETERTKEKESGPMSRKKIVCVKSYFYTGILFMNNLSHNEPPVRREWFFSVIIRFFFLYYRRYSIINISKDMRESVRCHILY